ncbi:MAG: DsrE/DsrF/DrsH-like family protein [Bacillota bacterium]
MEKAERERQRVFLICARNTLDGVYPPLILALQAVRAGAEAAIFFTFDGIHAIRRGGIRRAKYFPPGILGWIPGIPALATAMMRRLAEKRAQVPPPEDLLEMCLYEGVKLYGCRMTVDMLGLKPEDFVEGVEFIDAQCYMERALRADINMFI